MSVRELHRTVQQALGARAGQGKGPAAPAPSASGAGSDDEPWTLMSTLVRPEHRPVEPVAAPELAEMGPEALDERLKALLEKRNGWDEAFGVLARGFVQRRLAAKLGFANLGHYLRERLGMSRRAFEQRVWLEKRMEALPQLRHALEQGEVSYEKARRVAGVADFDSVNGWIRRAEGMTCVERTRASAGAEHAQA